jgi:putative transposase
MPWSLKRFQGTRDIHFITFSCYRRSPLLQPEATKVAFLSELERLHRKYQFRLYGYVLMPEHVHLLLSEPERDSLAVVIQVLKQNVSRKQSHADGGQLWLDRYFDFNVRTEKKLVEKLRYMYRNPVVRGLSREPQEWMWSSFRHYQSSYRGIVEIESQWTVERRKVTKLTPDSSKINFPIFP